MKQQVRRATSAVLGVVGFLLIVLALLLGYATRSLFDARGFSNRVAASLEDERFSRYVAEKIADTMIKADPDLIGLRPVLIGVNRSLVSSAPFRAAVRRSARAMHSAMLSNTGQQIVLTVEDLGALLKSALQTQPALAQRIPPTVLGRLGSFGALNSGELTVRLVRLGNRLRLAVLTFLFLGIVLCAASVWLSGEKRRAIIRMGLACSVVALLLAVIARFGGDLAAMFVHPENLAPPIAGMASAFLGGLMPWAAALGFGGLVLSAGAASLLDRVALHHWARSTRRWLLGEQSKMRVRLLRGLLGATMGVCLLVWPLPSLTVLGWITGIVVTFAGLREGFAAALHLLPEIEARARDPRQRAPRRQAFALVSAIAVLLIAITVFVWSRSVDTEPPHTVTACNGAAELCDRRLDRVFFPTTHNSMGGADLPGWMFPSQNANVRKQLEDGVRGFLIDVHYGIPVGDRVKTDLEDEAGAMAKYEAALGKEGMAAVIRIRDRLAGKPGGQRDVYLCHGFCELGSEKFTTMLREMREFLAANPGEVLIIVIQDEGVAPADVERCFQESGMVNYVYRGAVQAPWPTLREMVDSDQRVLVMGENNTAGVAWYHPAFEVLQETPYGFRDTLDFTNKPNRGGTSGSLALMNHWIESVPSPKPSDAAIVNAHDRLLTRIRGFVSERKRIPNLVAVDFYGVGDLIRLVRELNADTTMTRRPR